MSYNSDSIPRHTGNSSSSSNNKPWNNKSSLVDEIGNTSSTNLPPGHNPQRSDSDEGFSEENFKPRFTSGASYQTLPTRDRNNHQSFSSGDRLRNPQFSRFNRSFSPSARQSGEDILQNLKDKLKHNRDMFFGAPPDWQSMDTPGFPKVCYQI